MQQKYCTSSVKILNPQYQNPSQSNTNHEIIREGGSIFELVNAQSYIEQQVRKLDWPSYAISKHYPKQIKQDFLNLCWFNVELTKIEEQTSETSLGLGKINYWTNVIDQIYADTPIKEPLSIALHHTIKNNPLPKYLFQKILNGKKALVERGIFTDMNQMAATAEMIRGPQMLMFLRLLRIEIENQEIKQTVEHVSRAVGILDFVKRVPYTLKKYKLLIPEDIKTKHSINVRSLWNRIDGKPKEELYDALLEVAAFSRQSLTQASPFQSKLPDHAFRAFLHASEAEYYLENLEKFNFQIFEKALNTNSYVDLPYRIFKNARNKQFLKSL